MKNKKSSNKSKIPDINKTTKDLSNLVKEPGYLFSLLAMSRRDLFLGVDQYAEVNWHDRLSYQEVEFMFGLLIKHTIDTQTKPTEEQMQDQITRTYALLQDMHNYYGIKMFNSTLESALKQKNISEETPKHPGFTSPEAIIEAVFYDESGAYDHQYWEVAHERYKKDRQFIKKHFGFSIDEAIDLSKAIKKLCQHKANNPPTISNFEEYCDWLLDIFTFNINDVYKNDNQKDLLERFSVTPAKVNEKMRFANDFNELSIKPLVELSEDKYLIPLSFALTRSIDESPFYWMKEVDEKYFLKDATQHRGEFTEEKSYNLLKTVFGESNVHLGAKIHKKKGQFLTDIDVLVLYGNKAIIVQAKSKKLTQLARQGDLEKLGSDFKGAIQSAYDQALISRKSLLSKSNIITTKEGLTIQVNESLNEAYILTVTTDNYPALSFQSHTYLKKEKNDPFPISLNIFDLDLLCNYLPEPIDFIFYLQQRTTLAERILATSEISALGFHLDQKLYIDPSSKTDRIFVTQDFGQLIDDDLIRKLYGSDELQSESRLKQKWRNKDFDEVINQILSSKNPNTIDAALFLLTISSQAVEELIQYMKKCREKVRVQGRSDSFSMELTSKNGISYITKYETSKDLLDEVLAYGMARKYKSKSGEWLSLGSYLDSGNLVDAIAYSKSPWEEDQRLENLSKVMIPKPGQLVTNKVGRNDPCPCKSGRKYKKCCYLNE